ncbi:MAG: replication initiator [Acidimicrobiales bacterium]
MGSRTLDPHTLGEIAQRVESADFEGWERQVQRNGGCSRPVRLTGVVHRDGDVVYDTAHEPDRVLLKRCGTRRAALCASCAYTYAGDTWQLLHAGMVGGRKGVPPITVGHPLNFVTLTAPGFGAVHGRRDHDRRCHPSREGKLCPHGRPRGCMRRHHDSDPALGQPLCLDCYDHTAAVLFNWWAPELWRRFTIGLRRQLADRLGVPRRQFNGAVRVSFAKVAEFQRRGVVHFHAIIRLDANTDELAPPPVAIPHDTLADSITSAAKSVRLVVAAGADEELELRFGTQTDVRRLNGPGLRTITPETVAGYLAKYTTKATEDLGIGPRPITAAGAESQGATAHTVAMVATCERLAATVPGLARLTRWTHMLGFRGHFSTKSRRYSTTLGSLRRARADHQRRTERRARGLTDDDDDTTLVAGNWRFAGVGYLTTGDAMLAAGAAARAREWRQLARLEA